MMNSNDSNPQIDIAYIAVGRRSAAASAMAVSDLEVALSKQGEKITGEVGRLDQLYLNVDGVRGDIKEEARLRVEGSKALAQQTSRVQTNLNSTNAAVERTSTALTYLNNVASASEVVRVQITANGIRHVGGFGIGIENNGGAVQSTFAVLADRFAILSPAGDGVSAPFATQGNQTFIADAYIRDASIGSAKIAQAAIKSAHIGVAEIDTLRVAGNAITVPVSYSVPGAVQGTGRHKWMDIINVSLPMDEAGYVFILFNCGQFYTDGLRASSFIMSINGITLMAAGGISVTTAPVLSGSIAVGPGVHSIKVIWNGDDRTVSLENRNIFVMGTKR
jgi:hypothetical protein